MVSQKSVHAQRISVPQGSIRHDKAIESKLPALSPSLSPTPLTPALNLNPSKLNPGWKS
jgi:hypothetical protein